MSKTFRTEFVSNGFAAHVLKRQRSQNCTIFLMRYRRGEYNIVVSGNTMEKAKERFIEATSAKNIDKYRILDEWLVEFAAEGRRRTDLIRWDAFTTEAWWDHNPSGKSYLKLFPIPTSAMSSSNIIKQNPGYEY